MLSPGPWIPVALAQAATGPSPAPALGLGPWDWLVLGAYAVLLVGSGIWFARRAPANARDYFLAQRSIPAWAVAISLLATLQSAATFIGVPELSYVGDLTYLSTSLAPLIAAAIVALVFLPRYYRAGVASPYEYLRHRFGPGAQMATSWSYLLGRLLASGARTYIGALPLALAIFGDAQLQHVVVCIVIIMIVATLYTFVGGVRSVIWTDVMQVGVYLGAAVAALVVLWISIPASPSQIMDALQESGKLKVIDTSRTLAPGFTLWSILTGLVLLNLGVLATDQDMVQRSLTCKSHWHAARGVLGATLVGVPVVLLFLAIGLLLHVIYQRPDLMGAHASPPPARSKDVFQTFILAHMPDGLRGLMIAGVLAVGPIGINATLNSMASTITADTLARLRPTTDPTRELRRARLAVAGCAIALALTACLCALWQQRSGTTLISFALQVMAFAYAGLLGVFLCAVLTRRGNAPSAILALLAGFATVLVMQPGVWRGLQSVAPRLPAMPELDFSYQLVVGTIIAFALCATGRPRASSQAPEGPA